ncbi:crm1 protein [Dacryopinax primogenitus]|uniref:Crm1 protein n=1 Tax=Dacryopinax primogenitus (strain DJM 731) TaxID=1858805 RepID=M5GEM1_DACPD|nr:crm1 protein [Dacryopinax primogenitus]EJU05532.1 crm1 protein [Dacryopinax primogenitus]
MDGILDFEHEFDVNLFDRVIYALFNGSGAEQAEAQRVLTLFQEHPSAWQRVPYILSTTTNQHAQYLCCNILDKLIQTRWKALSVEHRQDIRSFITTVIIATSESEEKLRRERLYLHKLNLLLVQILKQDWPKDWPDFLPMIVQSSRQNLNMCENNMQILRLLSEEIFDYSAEQMTQQKTRNLKQQMCGEFGQIFELCQEVLQRSTKGSLVRATLETLLRFLNWIPLGYIFETQLIDSLITRFLEVPEFRNITLKCLSEIAGLHITAEYNRHFVHLFTQTMSSMNRMIPPTTDIAAAYSTSTDAGQDLVFNFTQFLTGYLTAHGRLLENPENAAVLTNAHGYLIKLSQVDEREVFKMCLEYWGKLVSELYDEMTALPLRDGTAAFGALSLGGPPVIGQISGRRALYDQILSQLRLVMIEKMVKPEEVLIVENEEGEIVREVMKETDTIALYKSIREVLIYLTHLDVMDTENVLTEKLAKQVDGSEWSWNNLNTLCWAIGSISGSMDEETEKRFLVTVIKDLLGLCEMKRGKDNKAVVASNIMYIVGQYPRFLKAHWKFLKTVVNKLFEFMHEMHEGVQEMACDTFIKIAQKCRRHFILQQPGETEPFIDEILRTIYRITNDLKEAQMHTFYEALGYMIASQPNKNTQDALIRQMMESPNQAWTGEMQLARQGINIVVDPEHAKVLSNVLKTNVAVCVSLGSFYWTQLTYIWNDLLAVYRAASSAISEAVATGGPQAVHMQNVRTCRTVKKDVLRLIDTFIRKAEDLDQVNRTLVPQLFEAVLSDYREVLPAARDAEVINVVHTVVSRLGNGAVDYIPGIIESIFEPTLAMISENETDFPEQRLAVFKLLRAIDAYSFEGLLKLQPSSLYNVLNSIGFAFKHMQRDVAEVGLSICLDAINNFSGASADISNAFFTSYYMTILGDILQVLSDSDHKSGFKGQCGVLQRLIQLVIANEIHTPLFDSSQIPAKTNEEFVRNQLTTMLKSAFGHMSPIQIEQFVQNLWDFSADGARFKLAVRDFLITLKEFAGDNAELYREDKEMEVQKQRELQMRVPGMVKNDSMDDEE